jgi:hypothetical protein
MTMIFNDGDAKSNDTGDDEDEEIYNNKKY